MDKSEIFDPWKAQPTDDSFWYFSNRSRSNLPSVNADFEKRAEITYGFDDKPIPNAVYIAPAENGPALTNK